VSQHLRVRQAKNWTLWCEAGVSTSCPLARPIYVHDITECVGAYSVAWSCLYRRRPDGRAFFFYGGLFGSGGWEGTRDAPTNRRALDFTLSDVLDGERTSTRNNMIHMCLELRWGVPQRRPWVNRRRVS
jgi:hypothetical protein